MTLAYLLDTMVVSEGFKKSPTLSVVTWLNQENPASLAVSVITFGEIAAGVEKQRLNDPVAFRRIDAWLQLTQAEFHDRTRPSRPPSLFIGVRFISGYVAGTPICSSQPPRWSTT